jgi:hypothetical protein
MLELIVSIVLAVKVFQADVASENGLSGYLFEIFEMLNGDAKFIADSSGTEGPISFLILILAVMIFSFVLIMRVPQILEREPDGVRSDRRYKYFAKKKKRFRRSRFFR